jgi:hypothetical protein
LWLVAVFLILLIGLIWWAVSTGLGVDCPDDAFCQVGDAVAST